MIRIYSLKEKPSNSSFNMIPEYVVSNIGKEGYYTLLAIDKKDEAEAFVGMAQFYVDINVKGTFFGELVYVYVVEAYRLMDAGYKLIQKVNEILREKEVDVITATIPYNEMGEVISDITEQGIDIFFRECGFITAKDDPGKRPRLFKLTRR